MRNTHTISGTPVQSALTIDPDDYKVMNMSRLMLGVVLNVYPSDHSDNVSAQQQESRHGHRHECDVLVMNDGSSAYMVLRHVVVTPDAPTSLQDYEEKIPRGSSGVANGVDYNSLLHQIDPFELDGSWCIVGYVGGLFDSPCVIRWWPHPRNVFDTATSGEGLKNKTLKQSKRKFERTNGVEKIITSKGDIIISTTYSNGELKLGQKPKLGRYPRAVDPDVGGSVRAYIKPSQAVEVVFDKQSDGIGVLDTPEPDLPQSNPRETKAKAPGKKENTYVRLNKESVYSKVPVDHTFKSGNNFVWESSSATKGTVGTDLTIQVSGNTSFTTDGEVDITSGSVLTLEGPTINHGSGASEPAVKGTALQTWLSSFTVDSPFGPLPATAAYVQTLGTSPAVSTKNFVE